MKKKKKWMNDNDWREKNIYSVDTKECQLVSLFGTEEKIAATKTKLKTKKKKAIKNKKGVKNEKIFLEFIFRLKILYNRSMHLVANLLQGLYFLIN